MDAQFYEYTKNHIFTFLKGQIYSMLNISINLLFLKYVNY